MIRYVLSAIVGALVAILIGPTASNVAAIRAYEKAGFRFLKTYLEPDSREQEHYLMELTRTDLDAMAL